MLTRTVCAAKCLTLIKGTYQPLPNKGHFGDFSPTETALLEKIHQCPALVPNRRSGGRGGGRRLLGAFFRLNRVYLTNG